MIFNLQKILESKRAVALFLKMARERAKPPFNRLSPVPPQLATAAEALNR
jgi:hypothetical protein